MLNCDNILEQINKDQKKYKKIYIGTTDLDWNLIDNVEKKINNLPKIKTYMAVGGSFLFPLAFFKNIPKKIVCFDRNKTMNYLYRFFVTLIKISDNRNDFLENLYCRKVPEYKINFKNMGDWLKIPYDKDIFNNVLKKLKNNIEICIYKTIILNDVIKCKNTKRKLLPSWSGESNYSLSGRKLRVSNLSSKFSSTLWYDVTGYLKSDKTFKNLKNILKKSKIVYLNEDLGSIDKFKKYINGNIYMFITNVDDGIAYLSTEEVCEIIQNYLKKENLSNNIWINSVLTGLHKINSIDIVYDMKAKLKYEKKREVSKSKLNKKNYNVKTLYIRKEKKKYFSPSFIKKILKTNLKLKDKGGQGKVYEFSKNKKTYYLKIFNNNNEICNEYDISKLIDILKNDKIIPDLYVNFYAIYEIYNENEKKYLIIMEKIDNNIWNIIDSKNIKNIKLALTKILIALYYLNHKVLIYHGDICVKRGKKGLAINNIMFNKVNKKKENFILNKKTITLSNGGFDIKIIDFGNSCFINKYKKFMKKNKDKDKIFNFNKFSNKFKIKSEILSTLYCLFSYYNFKNIDENIHRLIKEIKTNNPKLFDESLIFYIYENFENVMKQFAGEYKWPIGKYYNEKPQLKLLYQYPIELNNHTFFIIDYRYNIKKFLKDNNYKDSLEKLGKYYVEVDQLKKFNFNKFIEYNKSKEKREIVLLIKGKKVIGTRQIIYMNNGKGVFSQKFVVDNDFRSQGYGSLIHKIVLKHLQIKLIEYIRIDVLKTNKKKLKFDKKNKGKIVGETEKHFKVVYDV